MAAQPIVKIKSIGFVLQGPVEVGIYVCSKTKKH